MMKKIILTLLLAVTCLGSFAQLGITAGANIAKYTYAESRFDVHRKSLLAYNFGIQFKQKLTGKLFLQPELAYTLKGSRVYYDYPIGFTGPMKNVNKFSYMQLQLPAVISLSISDDIDYDLGAGLFVAYLVKATQKTVEFDDSAVTQSFQAGQLKKTDVGLRFTTGFRMGNKLGLHFNYDLGFINIQGTNGAPAIRTRNFSMNISWLFSKND